MNKIIILLVLALSGANYLQAQKVTPIYGRVGINTKSPLTTLDVRGGARIGLGINYTLIDSATGNLSFSGLAGYRVPANRYVFNSLDSPLAGLYLNGSKLSYEFRNTKGKSALTINGDENGNVGIGTSTPTAKLEVAGDAKINGITVGRGGSNNPLNTAIGPNVLINNTTGEDNTGLGKNSLSSNTSGRYNTALGTDVMTYSTTGEGNTGVGSVVLFGNSSGNNNSAFGRGSLIGNTTGSDNCGFGFFSLANNITGSQNSAFGIGADVASGNLTNATAIGANAVVSASNSVVLGNNANVGIGTSAPLSTLDVRSNSNPAITVGTPSLQGGSIFFGNPNHGISRNSFGVSGNILNIFTLGNPSDIIFSNGGDASPTERMRINTSGLVGIGTSAPAARLDVAGNIKIADGTQGAGKVLTSDANGLASWKAPAPSPASLQMAKDIEDLKQQIAELKSVIAALGSASSTLASNAQIVDLSNAASLQQNAPNPFSSNTIIKYFVPASVSTAQIIITDNKGATIKTINLTQKGNGQVTLSAVSLAAGNYFYSLIVDGKKADTKQMQLVK